MKSVTFFICMVFSLVCNAQIERCPAKDKGFKNFLKKFVADVPFQQSRVIFPLVYRYGDYSMTNPVVELWDANKIRSLPYPLIRNSLQMKAERMEQSYLLLTDRYSEVFQDIPDSDSERVLYKFRNVDGCWFLEEVHDKSE